MTYYDFKVTEKFHGKIKTQGCRASSLIKVGKGESCCKSVARISMCYIQSFLQINCGFYPWYIECGENPPRIFIRMRMEKMFTNLVKFSAIPSYVDSPSQFMVVGANKLSIFHEQ